LNQQISSIDNFPDTGSFHAFPMTSAHSINSHYQPAMCTGLLGGAWNLMIIRRSWLVNFRKESAVRPDEIVIG
jgi:hypothetical protein